MMPASKNGIKSSRVHASFASALLKAASRLVRSLSPLAGRFASEVAHAGVRIASFVVCNRSATGVVHESKVRALALDDAVFIVQGESEERRAGPGGEGWHRLCERPVAMVEKV